MFTILPSKEARLKGSGYRIKNQSNVDNNLNSVRREVNRHFGGEGEGRNI
jgi:hypothetical protein